MTRRGPPGRSGSGKSATRGKPARGAPARGPPARGKPVDRTKQQNETESTGSGTRLQKYLSDLGMGSRRGIEEWIAKGRVRVDGQQASLGQRVTDASRITVDGHPVRRPLQSASEIRVIAYNKPEGEICSRDDPGNRTTVFERLPRIRGARWVAVGRLDINTRGLMLFTTSGDLANRLMQPATGLEREYLCRVFGEVSESALETLSRGVSLDGELIAFKRIQRQRGEGRNTWYRVVVTEGRYREVRRLWESVQCRVSRLVRVRYGPILLARNLKPGEWVSLSPAEISTLFGLAGLDGGKPGRRMTGTKGGGPGKSPGQRRGGQKKRRQSTRR